MKLSKLTAATLLITKIDEIYSHMCTYNKASCNFTSRG